MLKIQTNADLDDGPHTLRSDLPSMEFSTSSRSFITNPLQISQSPTRGFIAKKRNTPDNDSICMSDSCESEGSLCTSFYQETHTLSEKKINQQCLIHPESRRKEELLASEEKYSDVQMIKRSTATEDSNISSGTHICPLLEQSSCTSSDHVNPLSTPSTNPEFNPLLSTSCQTPVCSAITDIPSDLKFYSFVILHVPEDQEVASRVCHVLQELVSGEGTTFCEGFETPGLSPITCLEDAVENSAYIILLLTNGFFSKWGQFQTNAVLMNSIGDGNKYGSVIPFYPTLNSAVVKPPLCLRSLSSLNEDSPSFHHKVRKTFKKDVIKRELKQWEIQQRDKLIKKHEEELYYQLHDRMHLTRDNKFPLPLFQGQPHIIQISYANNVQIGNQNSMTVVQSGNGPSMEMNGESCIEGDLEAQS
ncbi:TIR domain-containing adapter molecule 1 [Pseudophryne corroboree]|uniref:TIR domain-containing adapter molecule 1 n=1 Tax=Pseudophryne corroboree TaxID=495146 RepID=UPI003081CA87